MDLAGNNATKKGIDMALKNGFNVKVISMNSEKDPADIILSSGEDEWKKIIKEAKPINQFYFDLSFKDRDVRSVEDKKKIVSELLPIFKKIDNTIEQTYWIQKLAEKLSIREDDIRQEMKKVNLPKQEVEVQKEKAGKSRKELLEEAILSMVLIEPSIVETLTEEQKKLFTFLEKENNDSYIIMKSELLKEEDIDINEEWRKCVYEIEKIYKEEKRKKIMADIKEKEKEGSFEEVKKLLLEFNKLTKKDDKK
jgi:DNA primase